MNRMNQGQPIPGCPFLISIRQICDMGINFPSKIVSMQMIFRVRLVLLIGLLLAGCAQGNPTPAAPTLQTLDDEDPIYASQGGGEPRSSGYWLLWNSCAQDNRSETAATNGGPAAGWFILDDLLELPGILVGELQVETCDQGINLLQRSDLAGVDRSSDAAYHLAAELITAQVNLAIGSEYCPAVDQAVAAGQLLLISQGFDGSGSYLGPPVANQQVETVEILIEQLGEYNSGELCR